MENNSNDDKQSFVQNSKQNNDNSNNYYQNGCQGYPYVENRGSFGAGFLLGLFLRLIGLIIAIATGKPETKRGAKWGFFIPLIIFIVFFILVCVSVSLAQAQ